MDKIYVDICRCELSLLDGKKICNYLKKNGYKLVDSPKDADIILYFACAAFNAIEKNSLNKVKEYQNNYDAEIIVAGCLPAIAPDKLDKFFKGKTISAKDLYANPNLLETFFEESKIKFKDIEDENFVCRSLSPGVSSNKSIGEVKKVLRKFKWMDNNYSKIKNHILKNLFDHRSLILRSLFIPVSPEKYHIGISRGCVGNCSYCAIKKAIGQLKSKPLSSCINEFKKGLEKGYKNFVLNADDTGAYGIDIGSSFVELLDEITKIPGDYEIEIRNLHPQWLVKYIDKLEELIKRKKIQLIDCHIQSGSSRILKLMRRYSEVDKIKDAFLRLKKLDPNLKFYTSYITGFPTETDEEFKDIMSLIQEIGFNSGFIFSFNRRDGTDAEKIEPRVPEDEIHGRVRYAEKLLKRARYKVMRVSQPNQPHFLIYERR